jgi:hypothetical protein
MAVLNQEALDAANASIERGSVDKTTPWSMSLEKENELLGPYLDDWSRYGLAFLGNRGFPTEAGDKAFYQYGIQKLVDGEMTIFRDALPGVIETSSQTRDASICEAAEELLARIDGRPEEATEMPPMAAAPLAIKASLHIQALAAGGPARLPTFEMIASTGKPMRLKGWRYPVVLDLKGLSIPSQARPIRMNHDENQGVGHTTSIVLENGILKASGIISRDTPAARDVTGSSKRGFPWQASVGASADRQEYVRAGETVTVNGTEFQGPLHVVRKSTLGEISFVDLGADDTTRATVAARARPMETDFETVDETQQERARVQGILAVSPGEFRSLKDEAIGCGWSLQEFKFRARDLMRASRGSAPPAYGGGPALGPGQMLEAQFMLMSEYPQSAEKHFGGELVSRIRKPSGPLELCAMALRNEHRDVPTNKQELIQAAFSTTSMPVSLGLSIQKTALDIFIEESTSWLPIAKINNAQNFRAGKAVRLAAISKLLQVGNAGELIHGSLSEDQFDFQISTYGRLLSVSRQNLVNDDAGVLSAIPQQLGMESAKTVSDTWVQKLTANVGSGGSTYFSTANGNLLTGSLGITELSAAIQALRRQKDLDNRILGSVPSVLLVPAALEAIARQIVFSQTLSRLLTTDQLPTINPIQSLNLTLVVEPRLDDNSTTAWYLFSLARHGAVLASFLDGQMGASVRQFEQPPQYLGIVWQAFMEFGINLAENRAAIKSGP